MYYCSHEDCDEEAILLPQLLYWVHPQYEPAEGTLGLPLCKEHAVGDAEDYITDEGWRSLCAGTIFIGRQPPNRSLTKEKFIPIENKPGWLDIKGPVIQ